MPINMVQFRPINLCNAIYKIISKVVVNRFRRVLNYCIDETQEHSFEKRMEGSNGSFALKLDMRKVYDRVEWSFLEKMMLQLSFNKMDFSSDELCNYNILFSGGNEFRPIQGLRQGDPLSSYLFIICVEVFSSLLNMAKRDGLIYWARVGRSSLFITHLILFSEANMEGANAMKKVVSEYEEVLGQLWECIFGDREQVENIIGVRISSNLKKYPGLPTMDRELENTKTVIRWEGNFGGVMLKRIKAYIGANGVRCADKKRKGGWDIRS
ncbi:reverse transcriptase [Gossypium australe]|uniref:Reverse transcriptase n=1 Tax=Gossypium australe TaxID=47621 RepID=A0A5B6VWE7_9ROSI|nr:reverse transcriptase [Gossypium australe]